MPNQGMPSQPSVMPRIGSLALLSTKPTTPSDDDRRHALEDHTTAILFTCLDESCDGRRFTFVKDFDNPNEYGDCMSIFSSGPTAFAYLGLFTRIPLVGIGPLIARYCSPCRSMLGENLGTMSPMLKGATALNVGMTPKVGKTWKLSSPS